MSIHQYIFIENSLSLAGIKQNLTPLPIELRLNRLLKYNDNVY